MKVLKITIAKMIRQSIHNIKRCKLWHQNHKILEGRVKGAFVRNQSQVVFSLEQTIVTIRCFM